MTDTTKRTSDEAETVESIPERRAATDDDAAVKGGIIIIGGSYVVDDGSAPGTVRYSYDLNGNR